MRILGIDPGLATVGLGMIDSSSRNQVALDWCAITTDAGLDFADRLAEIAADLSAYIEEWKPEMAVVEKLYFATNKKTALDVAQARGVILLTVKQHQLTIIEPTPMQLKSTVVGDGTADKRAMQEMIMRILKLKELPQPDDAADGLALALYGLYVGKR